MRKRTVFISFFTSCTQPCPSDLSARTHPAEMLASAFERVRDFRCFPALAQAPERARTRHTPDVCAKSLSSHKNPQSEDALTPLLYFVGVGLRQMCNCVICSRPCQSNAESAGMPRLETLVTRPDASNHHSHVTWVFRITLRSSVSKRLRFGISTPC